MSEPLMWFGDKPHPTVPTPTTPNLSKTPVLTVRELRLLLSEQDQDAPVGACMSSVHGHVHSVKEVTIDAHGCVILDLSESMLYSDEVIIL